MKNMKEDLPVVLFVKEDLPVDRRLLMPISETFALIDVSLCIKIFSGFKSL